MPSAEIVVRFCNPQQAGKKNASIKTEDGQMYLVPPEMFSQFDVGGKYNIEYKTSLYRNVEYRYVEKVTRAAARTPAPNAHNTGTRGYGHVDMETAERIFVCGAMNALVGNQNIDPRGLTVDDLTAEVKKLRSVWAGTFGNPQKDAEMGDEIPF